MMKRIKYFAISVLGIMVLLASCNRPANEITLYVGAEQVDCTGSSPQKCYLVKYAPDGEWENFYDQIKGFDWQAGYEYELRVRVVPVKDPAADASSQTYELIEIVNKTAVK